jgi:hypothetical protein
MSSDDETEAPEYTDTKHFDELTVKLFSNKTNYAKYLAMTDERKHEEQQQFMKDCIEHKSNILVLTRKMCNGEENEYGSDVTESFEIYARKLIRYLEVKQCSDEAQKEYECLNDSIDENVMFPSSIDNVRKKTKYKQSGTTMDYFKRK